MSRLEDEEDEASHASYGKPEVRPFVLNNAIFESASLLRSAKASRHPRVSFRLRHLGTRKEISLLGVADTGAQSNLWGLHDFKRKGFSEADLKPVTVQISAANKCPLDIAGAFYAKLTGNHPNDSTCCNAIIYVSRSVSEFYLSYDTMRDLRIIDETFPTIGSCRINKNKPLVRPLCKNQRVATDLSTAALSSDTSNQGIVTGCKCPKRSNVPKRPLTLPFKPVSSNIDKMNRWLLNYFSKSTFNTCPHQPLGQMVGPPIMIHVDPSAKPGNPCKTAAPL